jgi:peptidoglycan/LPS O-acetylase OafA/YrhL
VFLSHIHSFRAVAILFVIAGHVIWAFQWQVHPNVRDLLADVLENGTVLFVFVSGYLFQHLSGKFQYGDYLKKKFQNVILPYLIISTPAVLYTLFRENLAAHYPQLEGTSQLYQMMWLYLKGGAHINYALWFIPMIALYFLLAPLFMLLVRHPRGYWLLAVLVPVSLLAHRPPFPNLDLMHLAIYFLSAYVAGMACSQFRVRLEPVLKFHAVPLLVLAAAGVALHFGLSKHHGNYEAERIFSPEHGWIDWLFLQKLFLCLVLLGLMQRLDHLIARPLRYLADISFTLFFVHMYFIFAIRVAERWAPIEGSLPLWAAELLVVLACGVTFAWVAQQILGRKSRLVIGS